VLVRESISVHRNAAPSTIFAANAGLHRNLLKPTVTSEQTSVCVFRKTLIFHGTAEIVSLLPI